MSCAFFLERRQRVLMARLSGTVTLDVLTELNAAARRIAAAEGPFRGIIDFSGVDRVLIESRHVAALGRERPLFPEQQRVIVAPRDDTFGLSRMFSLHQAATGEEPEVVRSLAAAYAVLGLGEPDFVPIEAGGFSADEDKPAR